MFLSFLQEEQRILQGVLSVRVHGNDLEILVQCLEIGESCFERSALAPVLFQLDELDTCIVFHFLEEGKIFFP